MDQPVSVEPVSYREREVVGSGNEKVNLPKAESEKATDSCDSFEIETSNLLPGSQSDKQDRLDTVCPKVGDPDERGESSPLESGTEMILPRRSDRMRRPVDRYGDLDPEIVMLVKPKGAIEGLIESNFVGQKAESAKQVLAVLRAILGEA